MPGLGMALLCIGFLMKAAQLPFRIDWQMHPALAPTPASGYISSVLLKSAIIGLIKLFHAGWRGPPAVAGLTSNTGANVITTFTMWVGGITIIMAAIQALRANGLKLVFIYSTVSQLGYMVLAVAAGGALGYAGGMLHPDQPCFLQGPALPGLRRGNVRHPSRQPSTNWAELAAKCPSHC